MGLFDNIFGKKAEQAGNLSNDKSLGDYVRTPLLAKLGEENVAKENYLEAVRYIEEYFELMNKYSFNDLQYLNQPCWFNLALAYSNLNEFEKAVINWTKVIQNDENNFSAFLERFRCLLELDRLVEAISDIDKAISLKPTRADLYMNKGIAYLKLGNSTNARIAFVKAQQLGNNDAEQYIQNYCR